MACVATLGVTATSVAVAQQTEATQATVIPDEVITVVAHRQPRDMSEVAGTVSVISDDELSKNLVFNAADLVRYEMGVELDDSSSRFGNSGFRIRGIGGNRTAIVVDQVAIADRFAVGSFSDTGRGLLDLGLANRVEILRGPASTLYGSDALGGVVAIHTLDAEDVLSDVNTGTRVRLGGASDAERAYGRVATAFSDGNQQLVLAGAAQWRDEIAAAGTTSQTRDAVSIRQTGALLKWQADTHHGVWQVSFDALRETRDSSIRHGLGSGRLAATTSLTGDDERSEWRAILRFQPDRTSYADRGEWRLFWQHADTRQHSFEERELLPQPVDIFRGFRYDFSQYGLAADLEKDVQAFGWQHRLGYGFEASRAEVWDERDAWQFNRVEQSLTTTLIGESFPLRDFPRSNVDELGFYIHDELELWDDGLRMSPGVRYERYELSTLNDALFVERYPNTEVTDLTHSAWLPKLGLLLPLSDSAEWFAQYARGYRAPPFADVNVGLFYPQFRVLAIANPDLKPERGYTFETGLRWRSAQQQWQVTAFHNSYSDFIESRASLGFDPVRQLLIFQSINRDEVIIEGLELSWQQQWHRQWQSDIWLEYTRSEDKTTGASLATVSPPKLHAELMYSAASGNWDSRLVLQAQRGQRQLISADDEALFAAPGYATLDWISQWYPLPEWQVGFGVYNLADRQYWVASQVGNYPVDDPVLPILAQAGRHVRVALNIRF
jgi:hemoglobin/transferrin/lactoferrin receptor protein